MGGGYDLFQCKGALEGTMGRCEFIDKSLALPFTYYPLFYNISLDGGVTLRLECLRASSIPTSAMSDLIWR